MGNHNDINKTWICEMHQNQMQTQNTTHPEARPAFTLYPHELQTKTAYFVSSSLVGDHSPKLHCP